MKIKIGEKIKELRLRDARKQDDLAAAVGVTAQAVSRWESGGSYPDLELVPSIANYFGVSIDELFGYQNDREKRIDSIIQKIDAFHIKGRGDDEWVDECLSVLRDGLAEFPQNERLMITLADTLSEAGWRRYHEWVYYDDEGYIRHDYDAHRQNPYWDEAIKLCKTLADSAHDHEIVTKAISILVLLYRNIGENEKAIIYADRMPELRKSREVLLAGAEDGKEAAKYIGELLLKMADIFSEQVVYGLIADKNHFTSDLPVQKVRGVIALWELICDDGNFGAYHGTLIKLRLYLSRLEWECGLHDDAFGSLDEALRHARTLESLCDGKEHAYTAPLVSRVTYKTELCSEIARELPDDWPFWHNPDYEQVESEMKADPRFEQWLKKCLAE